MAITHVQYVNGDHLVDHHEIEAMRREIRRQVKRAPLHDLGKAQLSLIQEILSQSAVRADIPPLNWSDDDDAFNDAAIVAARAQDAPFPPPPLADSPRYEAYDDGDDDEVAVISPPRYRSDPSIPRAAVPMRLPTPPRPSPSSSMPAAASR